MDNQEIAALARRDGMTEARRFPRRGPETLVERARAFVNVIAPSREALYPVYVPAFVAGYQEQKEQPS